MSLTSKERMLAALGGQRGEQPSAGCQLSESWQPSECRRLAVAPIYLHLYLAEEIRRRVATSYRARLEDGETMPVDPAQEVSIQARAQRDAWEALGETPDWIWAQQKFPASAWLAECVVRREGERLWRVHLPSGQSEELTEPEVSNDSTADLWQQPLPQTRAEVDGLIPEITAAQLLGEGSLALARSIVAEMGHQQFVYGKLSAPFWTSYAILGFDGLMTLPRANRALFDYILERQLARALALAQAYAAIGVHGVFIEECLTSADILSPVMYDRFVFPGDQVLFREFRRLGLPVVFYMTGDLRPRLERIAELEPAALVMEESKKAFRLDLAEVAAAVGRRLALFGNLDATLVKDWDDAQMERQIRDQVARARAARAFVVSMGSPFPLDTPRDRVAALIRIARHLDGGFGYES